MTAELPNDLAVADRRGVQGIDAAPMRRGAAPPRDGIETPVDRLSEIEIAITEKIEATRQNSAGAGHDARAVVRKIPAQQLYRFALARTGEEAGRRDALKALP